MSFNKAGLVKPKICVIIPMFNFGELTDKCVELTKQNAGIDIDILVVDDGSERYYASTIANVMRIDENSGFTNAINQGILATWNDYEYIHLLNNDTEPEPNFIKNLLGIFDKDEKIGIACSVRKTTKDDGITWYDNYPIDIVSGWTFLTKTPLEEEFYYCGWVPVCSALIKSETFKYVGLLDKRMRNHCSDNDFCMRAGALGYRTVLVTSSNVYHHHQVTTQSVGANAHEDQLVLLPKIRCDYMVSMLDTFPLDGGSKLKGKLEFTAAMPEKAVSLV